MIGAGGVEKVIDFELTDSEKRALEDTITAVKKTVQETGL